MYVPARKEDYHFLIEGPLVVDTIETKLQYCMVIFTLKHLQSNYTRLAEAGTDSAGIVLLGIFVVAVPRNTDIRTSQETCWPSKWMEMYNGKRD